MKFTELSIAGVYLIEVNKIEDARGYFFRTFDDEEFSKHGLNIHWKQANHSFSLKKGTFRGIHFQKKPFQEYKLIRCTSGAILDFGIDLRKDSKTLFQHIQVELNEKNHAMLLLPPGVGHAFQTLEDNTTLVYMHSELYQPNFEGGFYYDDNKIKLSLPLPITEISERDKNYLMMSDDFEGL
jgi:dTDP-4-dehydrorhamnose 3,5-epimerase